MATYDPYLGPVGQLDKNLIADAIEKVCARPYEATRAAMWSLSPGSGTYTWTVVSGQTLNLSLETDDVIFFMSRMNVSGDDESNTTWEVAIASSGTAVLSGSGQSAKFSVIGDPNIYGNTQESIAHALWTCTTAGEATIYTHARRLDGAPGSGTMYSAQGSFTGIIFKRGEV